MRYYIIAGEASGDLHGSNMMKEIRRLDPAADFRCWGGDLMEAQGGKLVKHYRDLAFMGFVEVIANLRTIFKNLKFCKEDILSYKPDALILVDYPGFNLRMAEWAHEQGIRVFYYISPTVWAWKESRVYKIKKSCERMFTILPFEQDFYKKFDYHADFVGHPLLDAMGDRNAAKPSLAEFSGKYGLSGKPVIAVLPGSRRQEIARMLPVMISVSRKFPEYEFVIAGAPSLPEEHYRKFMNGSDMKIIFRQTYGILEQAHAAMVTSGTATLETALFRVPEVVCYAGGAVSYAIARSLVNSDLKYISLVNLILDREVVKELIQKDLNEQKLEQELRKLLDGEGRKKMLEEYTGLEAKLGGPGASAKVADIIHKALTQK